TAPIGRGGGGLDEFFAERNVVGRDAYIIFLAQVVGGIQVVQRARGQVVALGIGQRARRAELLLHAAPFLIAVNAGGELHVENDFVVIFIVYGEYAIYRFELVLLRVDHLKEILLGLCRTSAESGSGRSLCIVLQR